MGGFFYIKELYGMRLDKFLKVSRLIKRRTVANEACSAGRVTVNGKTAKAGTDVKPGDEIRIQFGNKEAAVEVLRVEETVKKTRRQNYTNTFDVFHMIFVLLSYSV